MSIINELKDKFEIDRMKIYESEYWIWSLRPHQATVGSTILSLKRECDSFADLTFEEFSDLKKIVKIIETSLKKSFNYDVINYLMLMMFDKQVHYHILPRYNQPIEINGKVWEDNYWPGMPVLLGEKMIEEESKQLIEIIKNNI